MKEAAEFWDGIAERYARDQISDMDGYLETRARIEGHLRPEHRVFELGCGTGSTALELAGGVAQYEGADVSARMIEIARSKLAPGQLEGRLSFRVAAAEEVASPPVDVVLALNLLHLLPNLEEVLAAVHEGLVPGGLFIAKTGLLKQAKWYLPLILPVMQLVGKAPYVRSLAEGDFVEMVEAAGFVVEERLLQPGIAPRLFTVARRV